MDKKSEISTVQQTPENPADSKESTDPSPGAEVSEKTLPREIGGRGGLEPTRYGDWEKNGRCIDF
jgi:hypothetical protein